MYGGGDSYRDQEIYPGDAGYRGQNTGYTLYSGNTGLSVDLPSPDSGIGPDQVNIRIKKLSPFFLLFMTKYLGAVISSLTQ